MTPKRKRITALRIDEISSVTVPAMEGAVARIVKSADGGAGPQRHKLKNIRLDELSIVPRGANQHSRIAIAKAEEPAAPIFKGDEAAKARIASAMLAAMNTEAITKSQEKEPVPMTQPTHYENLVKSYANRNSVSISKAASDLLRTDPDAVAEAYGKDAEAEVRERARHVQEL